MRFNVKGKDRKVEPTVILSLQENEDGSVTLVGENESGLRKFLARFVDGKIELIGCAQLDGLHTDPHHGRIVVSQ